MGQIVAVSNQIAGLQLSGNQTGMIEAQLQLQQLKTELAKVEVQIKEVMKQIEDLQNKEASEQTKSEANESITRNINKAADAYSQMTRSILDIDDRFTTK